MALLITRTVTSENRRRIEARHRLHDAVDDADTGRRDPEFARRDIEDIICSTARFRRAGR